MNCTCNDGTHVDHINRNTLDNRKCNLRICTSQENKRNQVCRKDSISGYKGVGYYKNTGTYVVRINTDLGNRITLGWFTDPVEGAKVYDRKAIELFGEFAYTNFPRENYIKEKQID